MLPSDRLEERGRATALPLAERAYGPHLRLASVGSDAGWDGRALRWVHEERWAVWRDVAAFDLILDEDGRVLGFVDHEAYGRADQNAVLAPEDLIGLLVEQELLPARPWVSSFTSYEGPQGGRIHVATVEDMAEVEASDAGRGGPPRSWTVDINAARHVVVAIWPPSPGRHP